MYYEIYCPCKVQEVGVAGVTGLMQYFLIDWIHSRDRRARCKFCGETVRMVGCECPTCTRPTDDKKNPEAPP